MQKIFLAIIGALVIFSLGMVSLYETNENLTQEKKGETKLTDNVNDITVLDMEGNEVKMSSFNGKVLLILNVASYCGYTKQYKGLEAMYKNYKDKGLEILAFPCNDFGNQEPNSNEEIQNFCSANYGVTFKLFDKIKVKGDEKSPLFERLMNNSVTGQGEIAWNFEKFVVDKKGKIVARFKSGVDADAKQLKDTVLAELNK
ncbi:MAG TPA: glutathione peroxidase [Ignavibacteriaceae bacterium]|nr:glutathione peroxidase [Ignavibacteriaceae bacterium]